MHSSLLVIRALLLAATVIAIVVLVYAVLCDEGCYTVPCLSRQDYAANTLKLDVASSVSGVTYAFLYSVLPLYVIYILYTKVRSFGSGFVIGSSTIITYTALNQAISFGDQFIIMYRLNKNDNEINIYGTDYEINKVLMNRFAVLSALLFVYCALATAITCLLFIYREDYTVRYSRLRQSDFISYQQQQQSTALIPSISDF